MSISQELRAKVGAAALLMGEEPTPEEESAYIKACVEYATHVANTERYIKRGTGKSITYDELRYMRAFMLRLKMTSLIPFTLTKHQLEIDCGKASEIIGRLIEEITKPELPPKPPRQSQG